MPRLMICTLLLLNLLSQAKAAPIILNTSIAPPYQYYIEGRLTGSAINMLTCIMEKLASPYNIKVTPRLRAKQNVRYNKTDGFFISMEIAEINDYATLSAPIALEKWYLYTTAPNKTTEQRKVGVVRGSNEAIWLTNNHYPISMTVNNRDQLIKLLDVGRIDTVLFDKTSFERELSHYKKFEKNLYARFIKYTPLGVYFSTRFIQRHPEFMAQFNSQVYSCSFDKIALNHSDKNIIKTLTNELIRQLNSATLTKTLKKHNQQSHSLTQEQIIQLDQQWHEQLNAENQPLINKILKNPLSKLLQQVTLDSNGLYSELLIMDAKGLNIGISHVTSDYWQGDENKFSHTQGKQSDQVFIDTVQYDHSTRKYQVQASVALFHSDSKQPIGSVTLGINLEKALSQNTSFTKLAPSDPNVIYPRPHAGSQVQPGKQ